MLLDKAGKMRYNKLHIEFLRELFVREKLFLFVCAVMKIIQKER